MELRVETIMLGAKITHKWLTDLVHNELEIKNTLYDYEELVAKYKDLSTETLWHEQFEFENGKIWGLEIIFKKQVENVAERVIAKMFREAHYKIRMLMEIINCYSGSLMGARWYNLYVDGKYSDTLQDNRYKYNTTIYEKLDRKQISKQEQEYFLANIDNIIKNSSNMTNVLHVYNSSFSISDNKIVFLNQMIGLEAMLVKTNGELAHQVSRGVAVLLSSDKEDGEILFKKMKKLYSLRSTFVHQGSWEGAKYVKDYEEDPFTEIKEIFNQVFRKIMKLNMDKDELINAINESGYGDLNT